MKLILTSDVNNLGISGDIVEVKDGYGRNYLLPRGYAMKWTRGAEKQIEGIQRARAAREVRDLDHAKEIREQLEQLSVQVSSRVSKGSERLFGAVTAADVVGAIRKAGGPALDKRSVNCDKPIRTLGTHTVGLQITDAVVAHIPVEVVPL